MMRGPMPAMQRMPFKPQQQRQQQGKTDKELEDTLKKLKEMSE